MHATVFTNNRVRNLEEKSNGFVKPETIERWLALFPYPVEVRIPDTKKKTLIGYYDQDHRANLIRDVEEIYDNTATYGTIEAVYMTLNEFSPTIMARACNRIKAGGDATKDIEIIRRHWLPMDLDVEKQTGICSTDQQKQDALDCADEVREYLSKFGFPDPVQGDSGNGAHLDYRINWPTPTGDTPEDKAIRDFHITVIKNFYAAIALIFADTFRGRVKLDQSTFNASRVLKLYGTRVQKGDEVPELTIRHRMADLIEVPDPLETLTLETVQAFIAQHQTVAPSVKVSSDLESGESTGSVEKWLDAFILKHGIETRDEWKSYRGDGLKRHVDWCPNCQERDGGHILFVMGEGPFGYKCQHNRCKDFKWLEFRAHYEPVIDADKVDALLEHVDDLRVKGGESKAGGKKKRAYTITEAAMLPKPRWHVGGLFPEKSLVILWGQSGSGKSFLALEWSLSTAMGLDWLGRPVKQGSAVYIAAEGKTGIPKRCLRWLDLLSVIGDLGDEHALIVIDTLNKNLGGSENDGDVMGAFLRAAAILVERFKATVLIIHHTGWDATRERGHSSLRNNADAMLSAAKLGTHLPEGIAVSCIKQKDYEEFAPFGVKGVVVGQGDDSSVVLTEIFDPATITQQQRQDEEDQLIAEVTQYLPEEPGMTVAELATASGKESKHCDRVMRRAYNAQYVLRTGEGKRGSPFRYYVSDEGKNILAKYWVTG